MSLTPFSRESQDNIEQPLYIGPGVHLGEDGRVHIRLTINPRDTLDPEGRPFDGPPYTNTDFDPNLFYAMDDFPIFSSYAQESGAHYDGNVFRRPFGAKTPLFRKFGDGSSYATLDEFRAKKDDSGKPLNRWENRGLQIIDDDPKQPLPLLDPGAIEAPIYESKQLWDLYRPGNHPEVFTPGAEYPVSWPGAEGVNYRGAVGPEPLPPPGPRPGF